MGSSGPEVHRRLVIVAGRSHPAAHRSRGAARHWRGMNREEIEMGKDTRVLVTGAGGFIGHHLVTYLKERGFFVRGVDLKLPEYGTTTADEFEILDLRRWPDCLQATRAIDEVYALAADMGGMGFISQHHAQILHNNVLINTHTIEAARCNGVRRYLYTSSACVYPEYRQMETMIAGLREEEAYPAA